jgi:hypothetical protein
MTFLRSEVYGKLWSRKCPLRREMYEKVRSRLEGQRRHGGMKMGEDEGFDLPFLVFRVRASSETSLLCLLVFLIHS